MMTLKRHAFEGRVEVRELLLGRSLLPLLQYRVAAEGHQDGRGRLWGHGNVGGWGMRLKKGIGIPEDTISNNKQVIGWSCEINVLDQNMDSITIK